MGFSSRCGQLQLLFKFDSSVDNFVQIQRGKMDVNSQESGAAQSTLSNSDCARLGWYTSVLAVGHIVFLAS